MNRASSCILMTGLLVFALGHRASAQNTAPADTQDISPPADALELKKLEPKFDPNPGDTTPEPKPSKPFSIKAGIEEKDLAIEWDNWHNKVADAVMARVFENFAEALNVPSGATTWYHCEVTSDRHIKSAKILKSSGNLWFDGMILKAVYKLDGNDALTFPKGSKRTEASTNVAIVKEHRKANYVIFGDTEFQEIEPGADLNSALPVPKSRKKSRDH